MICDDGNFIKSSIVLVPVQISKFPGQLPSFFFFLIWKFFYFLWLFKISEAFFC